MSTNHEQFAKSYEAYVCIRGLNAMIENDIARCLKKYEMSFPGFRTLWILYFDPNITMKELTYLAQTNISNVFRQLTKLKEQGLIQIDNGKDLRTKEFKITDAGKKILKSFIDEHRENSDLQIVKVLENIPQEDFSKFLEITISITKELLGSSYTNWASQSTISILKNKT